MSAHFPDNFDLIADPALVAKLTKRHGPPWHTNSRGSFDGLNAEFWAGLFHAEHAAIFDKDSGFWTFDDLDGIFLPRAEEEVRGIASRRLLQAAEASENPVLVRKRGLPTLRAIVELAKTAAHVREPWNARAPVLALANGVLELNGGRVTLRPPRPSDRLRFRAAVPYDPRAKAERFIKSFLLSMMDEDDMDLALRYLGLTLFGQNPAHRMLVLGGSSSAGKTSLTNIVVELLGEDRCVQLRTEHLENEFELDSLRGRSLLIGSDVGEDFLTQHGAQTLKGLVSTDLFHPESKHRSTRRPLRGPFSVVIGTNCQLTHRSQGDGPAWQRRLILLECTKPEGRRRITDFEKLLLREEGPGIVAALVRGAEQAAAEIAAAGDLAITEEQQARIDSLVMRSDSVGEFVRECVRPGSGDLTRPEAEEAYATFCASRRWPALSLWKFRREIYEVVFREHGRPLRKDIARPSGDQNGWRGLVLAQSDFVAAN